LADEGQILDAVFEPAEAPRERKPRQQRKPTSYSFVTDLNLRPDNETSLKDFFTQKSPGDQQEQVAVFVYYLARTLELTDIGANHLYTCFNEVGKKVPKNILMVVRNTAIRKGWIDASDSNNLRITTPGENFVGHDLPEKGSN